MITHNLGYPRIGNNRELKKTIEGYWSGRISYEQLMQIGSTIKQKNEEVLSSEIKQWLAFAKQKVEEVVVLKQLSIHKGNISSIPLFKVNQEAIQSRKISGLIHNDQVKERIDFIEQFEEMKRPPFPFRKKEQQKRLELPAFPTTTIGSFPQTAEVRSWRAKLKKKELSSDEYNRLIQSEIENAIRWQKEIGRDVLVHGEFERNDMVEWGDARWFCI